MKVLSPKTGRLITVNGKVYKALVKDGWFKQITLPDDIIGYILLYLSTIKIINKYSYELYKSNYYWQNKFYMDNLIYENSYHSIRDWVQEYYKQYNLNILKNIDNTMIIFIHSKFLEKDEILLKTLVHKSQFNVVTNLKYEDVQYWSLNLYQSPKNLIISLYINGDDILKYSCNMLNINDIGYKILSYYNNYNKKCNQHIITIT